jgi:hypothetical protein
MSGKFSYPSNRLTRFWKEQSGGVLIYSAFMLPVILGVAGMSVDMGTWYASKRVAQAAADAGALAGALEVMRLNQDQSEPDISETEIKVVASVIASDNGYNYDAGDTIEVNYPPDTGSYAGAGDAVEVIVRRPAGVFLARLLMDEDQITVAARAVAVVDVNDTCMWGLNKTKKNAIKISGGAQVNMPCGILSNSNDPAESLGVDGGGCVTATKIKTAGGASGECIHPNALEYVNQVNDPFKTMMPPLFGGCDNNKNIKVSSGETVTLDPGVYCGKITVNSGGTLNFNEGEYVLDGAGLAFASDAEVNGTNVSFYITEDSGQGDNITISANADVDLSAPWDGDNPGVLFYQDRNSAMNIQHVFAGGATMNLEGILYFPNQDLQFTGGTTIDPVTTLIVADTITFSGNTEVDDFNDSAIKANPFLITVTLVE